jgi:hypothetical protein
MRSANTIQEIVGFDGLLAMNFDNVIPASTRLYTVEVIDLYPENTGTGTDEELTVGSPISVVPRGNIAHIPVSVDTAGQYILMVRGTTVDSQRYTRRGVLEVAEQEEIY